MDQTEHRAGHSKLDPRSPGFEGEEPTTGRLRGLEASDKAGLLILFGWRLIPSICRIRPQGGMQIKYSFMMALIGTTVQRLVANANQIVAKLLHGIRCNSRLY